VSAPTRPLPFGTFETVCLSGHVHLTARRGQQRALPAARDEPGKTSASGGPRQARPQRMKEIHDGE